MSCLNLPRWLACASRVFLLLLGLVTVRAHEGHPGGLPGDGAPGDSTHCQPLAVLGVTPFQEELPIPSNAVPARIRPLFALPWNPNIVYTNVLEYDMPMTSFMHRFHPDLPEVEVWGYGGSYPGPTIRATTNVPILVNWINNLPKSYTNTTWLVANTNFHGVPNQDVRSVVHLHGAATLPRYDGYPTNDFKSGFFDTYLYDNFDLDGDGETLWYHDHAIGLTGINVYAGLAGFYLLSSPGFEQNLNLPRGKYEIPLVFQDRDIQTNCSPASLMYFTTNGWPYHHLGVVNGKVAPYLEVEPRPYRFRVLNGANQRTFGLLLQLQTNNIPYYVIGTEDGFLRKTVKTGKDGVRLMPGERFDIIMDFSGYAGSYLTLVNGSGGGNALEPGAPVITNLMQFRVTLPLAGSNPIPGVLVPPPQWTETADMVKKATVTREITLDLMSEFPFPGPPFVPPPQQNTDPYPFAALNMSFFDDPLTERPRAGQTEIWSLINLSPDAHPIHVHLLDFRIVDRTRLSGTFTGVVDFTNAPSGVQRYIDDRFNNNLQPLSTYLSTNIVPPQPFEDGPKDVVRAAPYSVTRIVMTWPTNEIFYTSPSAMNLDPATVGRYIYHCHLLEHEDNDMMRPLQLGPPAPPLALGTIYDPNVNPFGQNHVLLNLTKTLTSDTYTFEASADPWAGKWEPFLEGVSGSAEGILIRPPSTQNLLNFYRAVPFTVIRPPKPSPAAVTELDPAGHH